MKNGRGVTLFLTALIFSTSGCNTGAPPQLREQASPELSSQSPPLRYQEDVARNRVWVLTAEGVVLYRDKAPDRIVIPLPSWIWAGAPYGCHPDLALGPNGEAIITSDVVSTLWRVDPETLAVSAHALALDADTGKDVGFSALRYSPKHEAYFAVSAVQGSLWRVDPLLERAQKIPSSEPIAGACGMAAPLS